MIRRWHFSYVLLVATCLISACGVGISYDLDSATLIITDGTVIDGTGADPIANGLVAIQDDRILAVGHSADYRIPDDVLVIDKSCPFGRRSGSLLSE